MAQTDFNERSIMIHFLYKTTNNLTEEYYIGAHSTNNIKDNYLGSGVRLVRSVNKYGSSHFSRVIVTYYDSIEHLYIAEKSLISNHLNIENCLNLAEGGKGGWTYVNKVLMPYLKSHGLYISKNLKGELNPMFGKHHSTKSKQKIGDSLRLKYSSDEKRKEISDTAKISWKKLSTQKKEERSLNLSNKLSGKIKTKIHNINVSKSLTEKFKNKEQTPAFNTISVNNSKFNQTLGTNKETADILLTYENWDNRRSKNPFKDSRKFISVKMIFPITGYIKLVRTQNLYDCLIDSGFIKLKS